MIVGLTGRKRSGKDTAAVALMDMGFQRLLFAGALKNMLRMLLDMQGLKAETIERMIEGDLKEEPTQFLNGRSPRHAMQTLGTEWGRDLISPSLWVDVTLRRAKLYKNVVITDVRFPNEAQAIIDAGGLLIRVNRPGVASNDNHPSEALIDQLIVHEEIGNVDTPERLQERIRYVVQRSRR